MLSARQRCLLSSPMDCSISSFSACGSARMEFGFRVVWQLRQCLGICREPKDAPPGCKGPRRFSRFRPWTGATGATEACPSPSLRADRRRYYTSNPGASRDSWIAASASPPRNCLLEPWYAGIFRVSGTPWAGWPPGPRRGSIDRLAIGRDGWSGWGQGSRRIRQGSPALTGGASISRISSARASASSLSSEESCSGSGVATSRPCASFDRLARR